MAASRVVFWHHFFMLVFGMVLASGLGGFWIGFWLDFRVFGEDFGRVWGGFWEAKILDFCPSQVALKILHRKNDEKTANIKDFGLPKPSPNPLKIDVPKNMQILRAF